MHIQYLPHVTSSYAKSTNGIADCFCFDGRRTQKVKTAHVTEIVNVCIRAHNYSTLFAAMTLDQINILCEMMLAFSRLYYNRMSLFQR